MQIFFIPSWYPAPKSILTGIFFQDQAKAIAECFPEHAIGISTWGQNDERLLLWAKKPFQSLAKWWRKPPADVQQHSHNLWEFFSPAYTWTRSFKQGNLSAIVQANEKNLKIFADKAGKVDVIHAHVGYPAGYIANILSQKYKIPYLITEQMSPFPFPYFLQNHTLMPSLRTAYEGAKLNLAISPSLLKAMSQFGIQRLAYLPNLIDEDFFLPAPPKYDKFTFFMLGRMVEQKGVPYLLEAIKLLTKDSSNIQFRLGGDGHQRIAYQNQAKAFGINAYVSWLGELNREQAKQEFQDCHAFVLPSLHETMGVVLAEALACGKPLVSTYCGGAESVIGVQNGLLAKVADATDLAEKLQIMIQNYAHYPPESLRQDALQRFSKKMIAKQLITHYSSILAER